MAEQDTILKITLFQTFQITKESISKSPEYNTKMITEQEIGSSQIVVLLAYLLCHRKRMIRGEELCEAVWEDRELTNPIGALKTLVYRARIRLDQCFGPHTYIVGNRGMYGWNGSYPVCLDTELFEQYYKEKKWQEVMGEYRGLFLQNQPGRRWTIPFQNRYHSLYINSVEEAAQGRMERGQPREAEQICQKALEMDMLEETIHYYYIQSLLQQGKNGLAKRHCRSAKELLRKELGVETFPLLQEIFHRKGDLYEKKESGKDHCVLSDSGIVLYGH